jgi:hypothetical protein
MVYTNISKHEILDIKNEHDLQVHVVQYLKETDLNFTCTLGGYLDDDYQRINATKEGYKKGVCDLIIFSPNKNYKGLGIELKTPSYGNGKVSKAQIEFLDKLEIESGYFCFISNNYTEIIEVIIKYIHNVL